MPIEKENVLLEIRRSGVVAVVRAPDMEQARRIVDQCLEGGLRCIELTFTIPYAHRVLEDISMRYGGNIVLGAGTVLDSETARIAILCGATFVVSPVFSRDVTMLCNRYRVLSMAGILTVGEAVQAIESGADVLKLFPCGLCGPAFIKAVHGPLPYAPLIPTGGVNLKNAAEWIRAGAVAIGVGSNLTKGNVTENARVYLKAVREARQAIRQG